ncbi:MAG: hypothetical protein ACREBI_06500 [Nitrosotalea sp.]
MSKHQYRSELGIISDVLSVIIDCGRHGAIISSISRKANLSHYNSNREMPAVNRFGIGGVYP